MRARREQDPAGRCATGPAEPASVTPDGGGPQPVAGLAVRRSAAEADPLGGTAIPPEVTSALRRRRGAGAALPATLRDAGEQALGHDLSGVRVHADAEAASLAGAVQAVAFTHGSDIYFAQGSYRPGDQAGQRLIAHELGHVAQPANTAGAVIGRADDPAESAADRSAESIVSVLRRQQARGPVGHGAEAEPHLVVPALRRHAARHPALARHPAAGEPSAILRKTGKGGSGVYWYTADDALAAVMEALGGANLQIAFGASNVAFTGGQRTSGEQWVSSDTAWGNNAFHFTLTFSKLNLTQVGPPLSSAADDRAIHVDGELKLKNLHATLRRPVDSAWIGQNIDTVLAVQGKDEDARTAQEQGVLDRYQSIQQNSLHAGAFSGGRWNSGNKQNTDSAAATLGLNDAAVRQGIGDLILGVSRSFGEALKWALWDKQITHPSAAKKLQIDRVQVLFDNVEPEIEGLQVNFPRDTTHDSSQPVVSFRAAEQAVSSSYTPAVPVAAV